MTREDRAFILAPLAMPFAFLPYAFFADISSFNMQDGLMRYIFSAVFIIFIGIPIVYLYEFFIAYRFYRLLLKKNRVNIFTLSLGGAFVAVIPILMVMPFSGFASVSTAFQLFSFVGFIVGLVFWYLLNFVGKGKSTHSKL